MNSKIQKPGTPWLLIVLYFVLSAIAIVLGVSYYRILEKNLLHQTVEQLSAIADLKVRQIIQWREERISDGIYVSGNRAQVRQFSRFLKERNNKLLKDDLLSSLKSYVENYDYKNALFIDKNINVKLFYPNQDTIIGDHLQGILPDVIRKGEVVLTDIHQTGKVSYIHLDLLVPLTGPDVNDSTVFGAVILRIDPGKVLFPVLQSWPISSKTAEALLVQAEGDEVVYLNKPKYVVEGEMVLRKPINEDKLPAAMSVKGIMETTDAIDYRGTPVIAAMKKVPEAPWYLIAKIDRQEVYASLSSRAGQVIMIVILFILTVGSFLGFLWWIHRSRFYREKYEDELERMALVKHFDYILKNANDIILLVDNDFKIVEANDRAFETYQYERNEFIGKNVNQLRSPHSFGQPGHDYKILKDTENLTFETIHRRKDGTDFPIEISARRVDIEGIPFYQSIGRDITERKHAEEILRDSEDKFRKIFEESPFSMIMTGKDMG
ncbi:MAG: PAS domain S-box protein, partial [Bacteroidia bacterium]|nr:PAS domain S-box protein [Bacteroidia bacterium]